MVTDSTSLSNRVASRIPLNDAILVAVSSCTSPLTVTNERAFNVSDPVDVSMLLIEMKLVGRASVNEGSPNKEKFRFDTPLILEFFVLLNTSPNGMYLPCSRSNNEL